MNKKNIMTLLMLSTTVLSSVGSIGVHASTSKNGAKVVQNVNQEQENRHSNSKNAQVNPSDWTIDTSTPGVVKLTAFNSKTSTTKDVVLPTAKDLGHDGDKLIIGPTAFKDAIASSNRELGGTFQTSKNGDKIQLKEYAALYCCFYDMGNITSIDLSNLDMSNQINFTEMFGGCTNLTSLDLSSFDTSAASWVVINSMERMFDGCTQLKRLKLGEKTCFGPNLRVLLPDVPTNETYSGEWVNEDNANQAPVTSDELIALTAQDAPNPQLKAGEWVWEEQPQPTAVINIPDANVKEAIKAVLNVTNDKDLTVGNLANYSGDLSLKDKKITDVTGIDYMINLKSLDLSNCELTQNEFNKINFKRLTNLPKLDISKNHLYNTSTTSKLLNNPTSINSWWESGQTYTETPKTVKSDKKVVLDVSNYSDRAGKGSLGFSKISNGGVYDNTAQTITWENIDSATSNLTFEYSGSSYLGGTTTVPLKHAQADQTGNVNVSYDYTAPTPADPGWYSVVPADVAFTDANKDVDTSVKLVNGDDQKTPYNGSKQVDVTVKSDNAYKLKDTAGDVVDYKLDKDGKNTTFFTADTTEQALGTLDKTTASIASKAHLTGTATKTGKYIDTLHYVFKEK